MAGTSANPWGDFDPFVTNLSRHTVPVLKYLGEDIERYAPGVRPGIRSTDKKADVVFNNNNHAAWQTVRTMMNQRSNTYMSRQYGPAPVAAAPVPTFGGTPSYGQPRSGYVAPQPTYQRPTTYDFDMLHWRATPIWKPVRALTRVEALPRIYPSETNAARRETRTTFMLSAEDVQKLAAGSHSVRLFCTSSLYFTLPSPIDPTPHNVQLPVDYPANPEVTVDEVPLAFKDRGLRNKAGSAPPLNLDPTQKFNANRRLGRITFRHTGPSPNPRKKDDAKHFWFQVVLVEWRSKEQLLKAIDALPVISAVESLAMTRGDDDDIEVGASKMTLKDPLSLMRMERPIRSRHCRHQQCFDATWWVETNYTHPQWLCPNCAKELKLEDLVTDGFFKDIQQAVGEDDVDEVILEGDNEWHTEDNKYGSAGWLAKHQLAAPARIEPSRPPSASPPPKVVKRKAIMILSSDDEDEQPIRRASRQPTNSAGPSRVSRAASSGVIDLTLSDDEDSPPPTNFLLPGAGLRRFADGYSPPPLYRREGSDAREPERRPNWDDAPILPPIRPVPAFEMDWARRDESLPPSPGAEAFPDYSD